MTYHDPCYLGRHNGVYAPPRELIGALPGVELKEMERTKEKSFCCGAGGARMWMEEKLGTRINTNRTEEAIGTGAERIAIGCPFCRVMMSDGLTAAQSEGKGEDVEVVDVAQMLLAAVKRRGDASRARPPSPPPEPEPDARPLSPLAAAGRLSRNLSATDEPLLARVRSQRRMRGAGSAARVGSASRCVVERLARRRVGAAPPREAGHHQARAGSPGGCG